VFKNAKELEKYIMKDKEKMWKIFERFYKRVIETLKSL
jgi:hypothetical protein